MLRWLSPSFWRLKSASLRQREQLALLLWPYLTEAERSADDSEPLRLLVRAVRAIEDGRDDFATDASAKALWARAESDQAVQQAAGALRTIRLQLNGDTVASGLQVAPIERKQLKVLHHRMNASKLENAFSSWLNAPLTLPLMSVLFLFSGWLFNTIFFNKYNLPVGRYFGLSDYLAASIEGLVPAVVAVMFTFATQWLMRNRIRLQVLQNQLGSGWRNLMLSSLAFFLIFPLIPYLLPEPEVTRLMRIYLIALAVPILAIPVGIAFSKRPARDTLLLNFLVIYVAVIWFTAEMRFINSMNSDKARPEVILANAPDKILNWRVISGNSLYLFLQNENNEVVAVPIEQVLSVRYPNKERASAPAATKAPAQSATVSPSAGQ